MALPKCITEFNMNCVLKILTITFALFVLCACTSVSRKELRDAFYDGNIPKAYELSKELSDSSQNENLLLLDQGLVQAAAGYNMQSANTLSKFLRSYGNIHSDSYNPSTLEYLNASYSFTLSCLALGDKDAAKKTLQFANEISKSAPNLDVKSNSFILKNLLDDKSSERFSASAIFEPFNSSFITDIAFAYNLKKIILDEKSQLEILNKAYDLPVIDLLEAIIALSDLKSVQDIDFAQNKFANAARKMPQNLFLIRDVKMLNEARKKGFVPNMTFVFYESGLGAVLSEAKIYSHIFDKNREQIDVDCFNFSILKFADNFNPNLGVLREGKFYKPLLISDLDAAKRLQEVAKLPSNILPRIQNIVEAHQKNGGFFPLDLRCSIAMPVAIYYASFETPKERKIYVDGLCVELADAPINIVRVRRTSSDSTSIVQTFSFK